MKPTRFHVIAITVLALAALGLLLAVCGLSASEWAVYLAANLACVLAFYGGLLAYRER